MKPLTEQDDTLAREDLQAAHAEILAIAGTDAHRRFVEFLDCLAAVYQIRALGRPEMIEKFLHTAHLRKSITNAGVSAADV